MTERFDRFDEALEVIDLLLTTPVANYDGQYYELHEAFCEPKPIQSPRPPFVIEGRGEKRLLPGAARWADHYNYPNDVNDFRYRLDVLSELCQAIGRNPDEIETSLQIRVIDIPKAVAHAVEASEAGADHVIFMLPPPSDIGLLEPLAEEAKQVMG